MTNRVSQSEPGMGEKGTMAHFNPELGIVIDL